jgi:hypothetical protein
MPENSPVPWEYCLYIPNDLRAVTVSRRTLRLILTVHGLIRLTDTAGLLATELVANAVRHAKGPAALRVGWSAGVLRLERSSKLSDGQGARRQEASRRSVTLQRKVSHFCGEPLLRQGRAKVRTAHMRRTRL